MSECSEPQQESAAACEKRDIGPFGKGPNQMITILFFEYLKNTGLEALWFEVFYIRKLSASTPGFNKKLKVKIVAICFGPFLVVQYLYFHKLQHFLAPAQEIL